MRIVVLGRRPASRSTTPPPPHTLWLLATKPLLFTLAVIVFFAVVFREHFGTRPWSVQDFYPWFRSQSDAWTVFSNAWNDVWLGQFNPGNPGVWLAQRVLGSFIPSVGLAQRLFYLGQLPLAVLGMYVLLRYFGVSAWVRISVSLLYVLNGFTIPIVQYGGIPTLVVHAGFPWFMVATLRFLRETDQRLVWLLLAACVLALVSLFQPYALVRYAPFFGAFLLVELVLRRNRRYLFSTFALAGLMAVLLFLLVLPFSFDQARNVANVLTETGKGGGVGLYNRDPLAQIIGETRQSYAFKQTVDSFQSFAVLALLLLPLLARLRARRRSVDALVFFVVGGAAVLWGNLLSAGHTFTLFERLPPLLIFRNADKLGEIAIEAFIPAMAIGLDDTWRWAAGSGTLRRWSTASALAGAAAAASALIVVSDAHAPYDSRINNLARFVSHGFVPELSSIGEVPREFEEIADWLRQRRDEEGNFRTLWLPAQRTIQTSLFPAYDRGAMVADAGLARHVLEAVPSGKSPQLPAVLAEFGVKYLVVPAPSMRAPFLQRFYSGPPRIVSHPSGAARVELAGDPAHYAALLDTYPQFSVAARGPGWIIYENRVFSTMERAYGRTYLVQHSVPPVFTAPNTLTNSAFSAQLGGWHLPALPDTGYEVHPGIGPGGAAVGITVTGVDHWGDLAQEVSVVPGDYRIAIWARAEGTDRVSFRVYFADEAGRRVRVDQADYQRANFTLRLLPATEWQQLAATISAPAGAARARVVFEARPGSQATGIATTWFSAPYFAPVGSLPLASDRSIVGDGDNPPRSRLPLLEGAGGILRRVPFVDAPGHSLLYLDLAESAATARHWQDSADVLVLLGNAPPEGVSTDLVKVPTLMQLHEAERAAHQSTMSLVGSRTFSGGEAVQGQDIRFSIVPPRAGLYWVLIGGSPTGADVLNDSGSTPTLPIAVPGQSALPGWVATVQPVISGRGLRRSASPMRAA